MHSLCAIHRCRASFAPEAAELKSHRVEIEKISSKFLRTSALNPTLKTVRPQPQTPNPKPSFPPPFPKASCSCLRRCHARRVCRFDQARYSPRRCHDSSSWDFPKAGFLSPIPDLLIQGKCWIKLGQSRRAFAKWPKPKSAKQTRASAAPTLRL